MKAPILLAILVLGAIGAWLTLDRLGGLLDHEISLLKLELQKVSDQSPELSPEQIKRKIDECQNAIIDIDQELMTIAFRQSNAQQ